MDLKHFHIFFMVICVLCSLGVAGWGLSSYFDTSETSTLIYSLFFLVLGLLLVFYTFRFVKKMKKAGLMS